MIPRCAAGYVLLLLLFEYTYARMIPVLAQHDASQI